MEKSYLALRYVIVGPLAGNIMMGAGDAHQYVCVRERVCVREKERASE